MTGIEQLARINQAGTAFIELIDISSPINWPLRIQGHVVNGPLVPPEHFIPLRMPVKSYRWNESKKRKNGGTYFEQTASGYVNGDRAERLTIIDALERGRFIALVHDKTCRVRILGTPTSPCTINAVERTTDGKNGLDIVISCGSRSRAPIYDHGENPYITQSASVTSTRISTNGSGFTVTDSDNIIASVTVSGLPPGITMTYPAIDDNVGLFQGTATELGTYLVVVTATDNDGNSTSMAFYWYVVNLAADVDPTPDLSHSTTDIIDITVVHSDPEGDWTAAQFIGLPPGLSYTSAAQVTGQPTQKGVFPVTLLIYDGGGSVVTRNFTWTITNEAPVIDMPSTFSLPCAQLASWQIVITDAENDSLDIQITGLPDGLTANATGLIEGTPIVPGDYDIDIEVTDTQNNVAEQTITLTITNEPPSVGSYDPTFTVGTPVNEDLSNLFSDPEGHDITVPEDPNYPFPPGLSFDPDTKVLTGTPTTAGTYIVLARPIDEYGVAPSSFPSWTFTINEV